MSTIANKAIEQYNENLRSQVEDKARNLVRQILQTQSEIAEATKTLGELREELRKLELKQVIPTEILGS